MSAWIVTSGHIDVLVHALAQYEVVSRDLGADGFRRLGQTLWEENHKSVNYRYSECTSVPAYQLRTTEASLDPIVVLKAVACYEYQTCEHEGWYDSRARDLMDQLHAAILERNPDLGERVNGHFGETFRYTTLSAWDNAPWGIDVLEDAIPVPA
jgi:hypothetical protein